MRYRAGSLSLGPFHGAIAVPSVTRCRCRRCRRRCRCRWRRGHRCAGGARQYRWRQLVNGREAARSSEWAQHFSNASCVVKVAPKFGHFSVLYTQMSTHGAATSQQRRLSFTYHSTQNSLFQGRSAATMR